MVLNYPVGEMLAEGLALEKIQPIAFLQKFFGSNFSGYVVATIEGYSGIEEGVLFFRDGNPVGAAFSYDNADTAVFGDEAAEMFFNALAAEKGIADVIRLTKQQVDLVVALDERTALQKTIFPETLEKRIPTVYNPEYAQRALRGLERVMTPASDIMKKIGLGELAKKN
jgi:hypothetical protein